ncbi:MAG: replicative DNA helicase [Candidatus Phytoplasma stylosanthis]|uniref:replicative DNA helicase n=1 Tax=Candidatus Phytoplasma stylosanthis TaxID=2798314 RepID=UPI00293A246A|nr:replicative DNA helicase [Candidatus Phytoplasma stylosanthis]MDV3168205.1 replicative DNA helicase [Candidatus Phytoplasma stylosanthis]MDV3173893.1 replicative DNA helicase [Candidatus Phytoplasma stylosanthis]MDV3174422.1 replicative DNA helicase [Candidatus Phytoplasma stylosanthis]
MNSLQMPFYLEMEQSILGIIFLNPQRISMVQERLATEDFFNLEHQAIYEAMKKLKEEQKEIDCFSVNAFLEKENKKLTHGLKYLFQLTHNIPSIYHLDSYIDFVSNAALKREVIVTLSGLYHEGMNNQEIDFENYLNTVEEKLFQIAKKKKNQKFIDIKTLLQAVEEKTVQHRENQIIGLGTGFSALDDLTLGFKPEELIILAARPAMGKSSLMTELALNIVRQEPNKKILIFSLEMANEQLGTRILSSTSGIEHKKIQLGLLNPHEITLLKASATKLKKYHLFFHDNFSANLLEIRSQCRQMKSQNQLDLVIIDYLQLINKSHEPQALKFHNRQEEIASITRSLKQMAKELKVPVLALSQLSREVEKREDKRPLLSDLRESGTIEQDADMVFFLYRPDYYERNRTETTTKVVSAELIVAKNRQGPTGKVNLGFDLNILSFREK